MKIINLNGLTWQHHLTFWVSTVGLLLATKVTSQAQVTLTGTTYSENFNSMGQTTTYGTTGWTGVRASGTTSPVGATLSPILSDGSDATASGGTYNFGTTGASDRALGSVASGGTIAAFGVVITNNTGTTLTSLSVAFTAEQWRAGDDVAIDTWTFQYKPGATAITTAAFTSPSTLTSLNFSEIQTGTTANAALNGNLAANRMAISGIISGLSIAQGGTLALRWLDSNTAGNDAGMGIDDFSMTVVPEPATVAAGLLALGTLGWSQRRRMRGFLAARRRALPLVA